jgi:Na+-driven multidrug efflux pump
MQRKTHGILDTHRVGRLLVKLTIPILLGTTVQAIYNNVDTIFIGTFM